MIVSKALAPMVVCLVAGNASADEPAATGEDAPTTTADGGSTFDRVWSYATLYENDENPLMQRLAFTGRLQADAAFVDSNRGNDEWLEWRRVRLGLKASMFEAFTLHAEVDLDANDLEFDHLDDAYNRLTDCSIGWSRDDALMIKVGKQSAPFTLDGATSSKKLITLERSTVATNLWFPTEYFTGLAAMGEIGAWAYHLGGYSASGDAEFGSFDSGAFGLASLGYDFAEQVGLDVSFVRLDVVYNDPDDTGDVGTRDLRHVITFASTFESGAVGLSSGLSFGTGIGDQSDLFGLEVMPHYDLNERWQAVFRYTCVTSAGDPGVRLNRYESRLTNDRFDDAQEFFLGLNWYLYGHKLKWQSGVEYTSATVDEGTGYFGWGFTTGIRLSW